MEILIEKIARKVIPSETRYNFNLYPIDEKTLSFIKHNKKTWDDRKVKKAESEILVDFYPVSQTVIAYSYFLNILASRHNACIKTFSLSVPCNHPALYKAYQSFNTAGYVVPALRQGQEELKESIYQRIIRKIKTKNDVLDLCIDDLCIGIDIYETYLKKFNKPTIEIGDPALFALIDESVKFFIFWKDYLERNKVAAVVVSHDVYINLNILCKLAYQKKIPVYLPYILGITYADRPFSGSLKFKYYRELFRTLSEEEQLSAIELAKKQIEKRCAGEIGVDMPYSTKSAFGRHIGKNAVLRKSNKIKVLIATHCFYDNPHAYGVMLFVDFYEWLRYLGNMTERTDYDWYIKMHPDPLPGTEKVIREIISEFPRITLIPHETSHLQLFEEGIDFVLTGYGSVGHEYPLFGAQVINAGYNPHIAYDFNWHPKSMQEYEHYLLNLDKLKKEINVQEIYEFYYMHYYYFRTNNLYVDSYQRFVQELNRQEQINSETYRYFLNQLTGARHKDIIDNISSFINSGMRELGSHGPALPISFQ